MDSHTAGTPSRETGMIDWDIRNFQHVIDLRTHNFERDIIRSFTLPVLVKSEKIHLLFEAWRAGGHATLIRDVRILTQDVQLTGILGSYARLAKFISPNPGRVPDRQEVDSLIPELSSVFGQAATDESFVNADVLVKIGSWIARTGPGIPYHQLVPLMSHTHQLLLSGRVFDHEHVMVRCAYEMAMFETEHLSESIAESMGQRSERMRREVRQLRERYREDKRKIDQARLMDDRDMIGFVVHEQSQGGLPRHGTYALSVLGEFIEPFVERHSAELARPIYRRLRYRWKRTRDFYASIIELLGRSADR